MEVTIFDVLILHQKTTAGHQTLRVSCDVSVMAMDSATSSKKAY